MPQINQTETLTGFAKWINGRRGVVKVGENCPNQPVDELVHEFLVWNDLDNCTVELAVVKRSIPPRLWFRYTPWLGSIEWCVRKFIHDITK